MSMDSRGAPPPHSHAAAVRAAQNKRHRERCQVAETKVEGVAAAIDAARAEQAALDAIHGSLVAAERHQRDLLQALQVAALVGAAGGEGDAAHWRTCTRPPAGLAGGGGTKPGFMEAVGGWSQRVAANVRSLLSRGVFEALMWGGYTPTDADLRDYLLVCGAEDILQRMVRNQSVCADLLAQWQSGVEDMARMEAGVRNICSVRARFIRSLGHYRPDLMAGAIKEKVTPTPPGMCRGAGGAALSGPAVKPGRLHPSLLFVVDLDWSEAQRAALRPKWRLYQDQVASCRALAQYHLRGLQAETAMAIATWGEAETLPALMASYAGVFDSAAGLDSWLHLEAKAWADLSAACIEVLTPYQALSISAKAHPYLADYAQIVEWVVDGGEATDGTSRTGRGLEWS